MSPYPHIRSALMEILPPAVPPTLLPAPALPHDACPWLSGGSGDGDLVCFDGSRCTPLLEGWDCCTCRGGRAQCVAAYPFMCEGLTCGGGTSHCCTNLPLDTCQQGLRVCRIDNWMPAPAGYCAFPPPAPPSPPDPPAPPPAPPSQPYPPGPPPQPPQSPPPPPPTAPRPDVGYDILWYGSCALNLCGSLVLVGTFLWWPKTRRSFSLRLLVPLALSTAGNAVGTILLRCPELSCGLRDGIRIYFQTAADVWTIPFAVATRRCILRAVVAADAMSSDLPRNMELTSHILCWGIPFGLVCRDGSVDSESLPSEYGARVGHAPVPDHCVQI